MAWHGMVKTGAEKFMESWRQERVILTNIRRSEKNRNQIQRGGGYAGGEGLAAIDRADKETATKVTYDSTWRM